MKKIIDQGFYERGVLEVGEALLGMKLCRRMEDGKVVRGVITEVEAYDGPEDKACHAHKGKTARNEVMFGEAGVWYVYLCYGVHWLLNIVTGPVDYPAAVLIRGIVEAGGPGKLTKRMGIDKQFNKLRASKESGLWIEAGGERDFEIERTARVGIDYAGEEWASKPYRFLKKG